MTDTRCPRCSLLPGSCACEEHLDAIERAETDEQRLAGFRAENQRLRSELRALLETSEKLRADLDRMSGAALDYSRDTGRVHRALDDAQVPKANPEPGKPWRIDDRVRWLCERRAVVEGLADQLEEQLAQRGSELAEAQHVLKRLQLAALRVVAFNGGRS